LLAIWGKGKGGVSGGEVASGDWEVGTHGKGSVESAQQLSNSFKFHVKS